MSLSKILTPNTPEYYDYWTSQGKGIKELAELEGVTQGCISKRLKKWHILPANKRDNTIQNEETFQQDGNMKTDQNPKSGGGSSKRKSFSSYTPNPSTPLNPSADEPSSIPIELTPDMIERAIIQNLITPDPAKTNAINLAQNWLQTKNKLNINEQTDEVISQSCKRMPINQLIGLVMEREKEYEPTEYSESHEENSQTESYQ